MNIPGFTAAASLNPTEGRYRAAPAHRPTAGSVHPMADLIMLDAYGTRSNAGYVDTFPEDVCTGLRKCCDQGYLDCCIAYRKSCM